jgi:hypothetical protein
MHVAEHAAAVVLSQDAHGLGITVARSRKCEETSNPGCHGWCSATHQ